MRSRTRYKILSYESHIAKANMPAKRGKASTIPQRSQTARITSVSVRPMKRSPETSNSLRKSAKL